MQCYLKKAEIPEDTATLGKKKKKKMFRCGYSTVPAKKYRP